MNDFLEFLKLQKLYFNWESYALNGNILKIKNNIPLNGNEIKCLINNFFKFCTYDMKLVKGAVHTLNLLSKYFNIIILSNIPFQFYELRKNALLKNNLNYPFFANTGEKGEACSKIFRIFNNQTWFIDDSPFQVSSVKKKQPDIKTILFIANAKLAKLIRKKNKQDFYTSTWSANKKILLNNFVKNE